jgi:hypothetical protein
MISGKAAHHDELLITMKERKRPAILSWFYAHGMLRKPSSRLLKEKRIP